MKFYIATLFLLHGLSPLPGMSFGFVFASFAMILGLFNSRMWHCGLRFRLDDGFFGVIFLLGVAPLLLHPSAVGSQNLIYSVQWAGIWVVSFWWIREWLLGAQPTFGEVSRAAAVGCLILSVAVLLEFTLANTLGIYLSDLVHFSIGEFPPALVFEDAFLRPRGFASEAGFTAIAFECLIPLSFHWVRQTTARRWLFPTLVAPAYLLLFSAASMSFLVVTVVAYVAIFHGKSRAMALGAVTAGIVGLGTLSSTVVSFVLYQLFLRKYLEFSPSDIAAGADTFSRPEAYLLALKILRNQPLGIGWGGVSQQLANSMPLLGVDLKGSGLISVPLEIGACAGVGGLVLCVFVLLRKLRRLARLPGLQPRLVFFSLLWVALHHAVVLEFWFPMLWFGMAMADYTALQTRNHSARSPRLERVPSPSISAVGT